MHTASIVLIGGAERRGALRELLRGLPGYELSGEITAPGAERLVGGLAPDLVLVDAAGSVNPLALLPHLAALANPPAIVVVTATDRPAEQRLMLELGAHATARLDQPAALAAALRQALARRAGPAAGRERQPAIEWPRSRAA